MIADNISLNTQNSIRIATSIGNIYIDPLSIKSEPHDATFILITHEHYDHYSPEDILRVCNEDTILVVPEKMVDDTGDLVDSVGLITTVMPDIHKEISGLIIDTIPAYNKLKPFHPKRAGWVGYILTVDDTRIYIAGDTDITNENEVVNCDIAIVPIGGKYTMNAIQ
ncbi:MAG: MBL fold metallo-hydrolase, partial [Lachnospiraceae bacterium]|nr:MBL fold metallo-hydrolase [Lachnospiraceae bacterium]